MIIKEKSIKSYANLERVLRYILHKNEQETFVYKRFIKGDRVFEKQLNEAIDVESISILQAQRLQNMKQRFVMNDKGRLHKRKGETKFYHCILSFHKADRLTQEQLLLVAKHYAKTRFPKSIVVATNHTDTKHQHIHLIGSNVEYGLYTTRYLTREEFKNVKLEMEAWQDRVLGPLEHSRVDHSKKKQNRFVKMPSIKSIYEASKVKNKRLCLF